MTEPACQNDQKEKTAQLMWTVFILFFFLIQAIIWTIAISLTANDKSHAVVDGYDERALKWDEEIIRRNESRKLGWQCTINVDAKSDIRNFHLMTLELRNQQSGPVNDATVQLTAFHQGHAGEPQRIEFEFVGDGSYSALIRIANSGIWRLEGSAVVDQKNFLINKQLTLQAND